MRVPAPGAESTVTRPAERPHPVAHVHEAVARCGAPCHVEARRRRRPRRRAARPRPRATRDRHRRPLAGVLARVLQRLEAAEVHGRLHLLRVAADTVGLDAGRQRGAAGRGAERLGEPAVHEQRRVDAVREVAQLLHRVLEVGADLLEHRLGLLGVGVGELAGEPHAHRERDEVLLRAVVQVALDAAPLGVGRLDDARPRDARSSSAWRRTSSSDSWSAESSLHVVQGEADLAGQLGERLVVRPRRTPSRPSGRRTTMHPSSSPEFVIGATLSTGSSRPPRPAPGATPAPTPGPRRRRARRPAPPRSPSAMRRRTPVGNRRLPARAPGRAGPHLGDVERERLLERLGQLEQQLVEGQRAGQAAAEGAQHLVGRVTFAVDPPGWRLVEALARRDPQQRGDSRGEHRQTQHGSLVSRGRPAEAEHDEHVTCRPARRGPRA